MTDKKPRLHEDDLVQLMRDSEPGVGCGVALQRLWAMSREEQLEFAVAELQAQLAAVRAGNGVKFTIIP